MMEGQVQQEANEEPKAATLIRGGTTMKKYKKVPDVTIVRIPKFRAVTSGLVSPEEVFGKFDEWQKANKGIYQDVFFGCADFLMGKDEKMEWIWAVKDDVTQASVKPYEIIVFEGGLYAVAVSADGDGKSHNKVRAKVDKWLKSTGFVEDTSRMKMGHMVYIDDEIKMGLGYNQMNLYLPIKIKEQPS